MSIAPGGALDTQLSHRLDQSMAASSVLSDRSFRDQANHFFLRVPDQPRGGGGGTGVREGGRHAQDCAGVGGGGT